jgi:HK97 family phage prohead protease
MNEILSYKSIVGEVKDVDTKKRVITGYLSGFDNKDFDGDIIVKGAFKKSIDERKNDIYFLNQHNWSQPHGKFSMLKEDSKGLYFESEPLIDTSYSSDTLKLYEAGIVKEHSIGFQTILSDYDTKANARMIKEVKLYEGSNVTLGANPDTPFTGTETSIRIRKEITQNKRAVNH